MDTFNQQILGEALEFQAANLLDPGTGKPGEPDWQLDQLISDMKLARETGASLGWRELAIETKRYLLANGYCEPSELPDLVS